MLALLAAGHLALIPASGGVLSLGAVLLLARAAISPAEASVNAMVDDAAPPGTTTEAFAWLASAHPHRAPGVCRWRRLDCFPHNQTEHGRDTTCGRER
ncbi:MAG TPA: hypothetical protein VFI54_10605, partial [Solirubrobacteraceae bacterium]|nr:hypothetical protein [Solirubrobacteraceae bacterium]